MTSSEPGGGRDDRAAPRPRGIAASVSEIAGKRPPPPKGKGVAMVVIGVGVLVAVILTFVLPHDLSERWKEEALQEGRVASPGPYTPATEFPVPDGLSEPVRTRLQEALNGMTRENEDARRGLRALPTILREAPEADRAILEAYILETLTAVAGSPTVGPAALDAAIELAGPSRRGLGPVIAAARTRGLGRPETIPAALALLDTAGDDVHRDSAIAVLDVVMNEALGLHLRVLAARMLVSWGEAGAQRRALIEDAGTTEALRRALR